MFRVIRVLKGHEVLKEWHVAKGSCDSLSDLSSYYDDPPDESHSQTGRGKRKQKKDISIYMKQDKCPGCQAPLRIRGQLLNSRTYNIALETDPNTCAFHRKLRHLERVHIRQMRKTKKTNGGRLLDSLYSMVKRREGRKKVKRSVYEFESDASQEVSPASQSSDENSRSQHYVARQKRRPRLEYTEEEEQNLLEGVRKMGKSWRQILLTYHFHPSRTAVDLKDKFKSMKKSSENKSTMSSCSSVRSRTFKPFSMCEERRLRRGIQKFGYSWKTILDEFNFSRDRTAEDLRNRWRSMHRRGAS